MEAIGTIDKRHGAHIVEDAAQGVRIDARRRASARSGTFGPYSFQETKVVSCGQGGALNRQ